MPKCCKNCPNKTSEPTICACDLPYREIAEINIDWANIDAIATEQTHTPSNGIHIVYNCK